MGMFPPPPGRADELNIHSGGPVAVQTERLQMNRRELVGMAAGLAATTMFSASAIASTVTANPARRRPMERLG